MKILAGLFVLILLCFAGANAAIYLKYGKIPLSDWSRSIQQNGISVATNELIAVYKSYIEQNMGGHIRTERKQVQIYKWTDKQGVIHYENHSVPGAQSLTVDPDNNVVNLPPVATLPAGEEAKPKAKTMDEETQQILEKKRAYMESLTQ